MCSGITETFPTYGRGLAIGMVSQLQNIPNVSSALLLQALGMLTVVLLTVLYTVQYGG